MPLALTTQDLTIALALKARNELRAPLTQGKKDVKDLGQAAEDTKKNFKGLGDELSNVRRLLVAAGIAVAIREIGQAGLEMERINLTLRATTGSAEGAARELAFLREEAERLGLNLRRTAGDYGDFTAATRNTNLEGEESRKIFSAVVQAMAVLGRTSHQTSSALFALQQMVSKGVVSQEELRRQLGEQLPGAFKIAARAMGVTTIALNKMVESGELLADEFLPKLGAQLEKEFGDRAAEAGETARASFARFQTQLFETEAALAESGIIDLMAAIAEGGGEAMKGMEPFIFALRDLGDVSGATVAFLAAVASGDLELAQRINALREAQREANRELREGTDALTSQEKAQIDLVAQNAKVVQAFKESEAAAKKLATASADAFQPALDAVGELLELMQSQADKAAELREKVFEATGGAAEGFFDDQVRMLQEEVRAMLEANISFSDATAFAEKRLSELRERAVEAGATEQVQRLEDLARQNTDNTLNFVNELHERVGQVNRRTEALSGAFADAQTEIVEAGQALVNLLPAEKQQEVAGRLNSLLGIIQQMGADAHIQADFDINQAIAAINQIQSALAAIPRQVVTQHIIQRIVVGAAPPPPGAGGRATGGLVDRDGTVQVHEGERIVSTHSQTFGDFHFNMPGRMSPAEARAFVRNVVIPELDAAAR